MNKENPHGPTLFIDSIQTNIKSNHSQNYCDSRNKNIGPQTKEPLPKSLIIKKLEGIKKVTNKNSVKTIILTKELNYEGTFKDFDDNYLIIEDDSCRKIPLNIIDDIYIV